nr:MAG TPA: hypothetical protein [Caudoviricetes sp.]
MKPETCRGLHQKPFWSLRRGSPRRELKRDNTITIKQ